LENEGAKTGKTFNAVIGGLAGLAALVAVLVLALGGLGSEDEKSLEATKTALQEANERKGPLPTPEAVQRWERYRKDLSDLKRGVEGFYRNRDGNLEKYFAEFDPRSSGDRFRMVYRQKTLALYDRASPVLAKDPNGNPAPMVEVFAFTEWGWAPSGAEVRGAQKEYNLQETVVEVLLEVLKRNQEAENGHLEPMLLKLAFGKPNQASHSGVAEAMPCSMETLIDSRDVQAVLAGILGPGKHGLLVHLDSLAQKKEVVLQQAYRETVKQGEEPKLKPDAFLKHVRLTLGFEVLDYPSNGAG